MAYRLLLRPDMMRGADRQRGFTLVELLVVVALLGIIGAFAVPMAGTALDGQGIKGDAQALTNLVGLAKMRASSGFTRARVRANLTDATYTLERWDNTSGAWIAEGGLERTYRTVAFGFAPLTSPPPNSQTAIAMSPQCRTGIVPGSPALGNTACIVFNSRGLPVDGDGALFGGHALYLTDGTTVYATTVTATPRIRLWWTAAGSPGWRELQ